MVLMVIVLGLAATALGALVDSNEADPGDRRQWRLSNCAGGVREELPPAPGVMVLGIGRGLRVQDSDTPCGLADWRVAQRYLLGHSGHRPR
jgi:hypothetical protein